MSNKTAKLLVVLSSIVLLISGGVLYIVFEKAGYGNNSINKPITYNIKDYVETTPVLFSDYNDTYTSINVSRVNIKNIDNNITGAFLEREEELINYIGAYRQEMVREGYTPSSSVTSNIKMQINGTILSIYYELDFVLDSNIFDNNIKKYFISINIDLNTNRVLSNDDLLSKYDYTREYLSQKIFEEDVLISDNQVVIDKNTNISLTKSDIEKKKSEYTSRIVNEFDNLIVLYIEDKSLAMVYDKKEVNNIFFDNNYSVEVKCRYLK